MTKNVGQNIRQLRSENQSGRAKRGTKGGKPRSQRQILAIALSEARRHGNRKIKPKPGTEGRPKDSGRTPITHGIFRKRSKVSAQRKAA